MSNYILYQIEIVIKLIIVLCALNISLSQININLISKFENLINFKFEKYMYIIGGICTIIFILNKHNWLPFLGSSVLPSSLVPLKTNNGDTKVTISVPSNTKIAYWSSKPSNKELPNVDEAYDDYSNSGVVMSDNNGKATLIFNKGTNYVVPSGRVIEKHVHYRIIGDDYAMMGPVQTINL